MNKWDAKNSIEQEKNFSNNNVLDQKDTIQKIEKKSTSGKCKDIGKRWERSCPKCGDIHVYSSKYKLLRAIENKSVCIKCYGKSRRDTNTYCRDCPTCGKRIDYENRTRFEWAVRNHTDCQPCAMRKVNSGRIPTEQARANMSKAQVGRKHSKETLEKMKGENNGMFGVFRCGKNNPFFGKKHSEESRTKMRLSMCNKIVQKNKITGQIGNVNPKETAYFKKLEKRKRLGRNFLRKIFRTTSIGHRIFCGLL